MTGQWSEVIPLPNVPIHTHVLPTGKILFWGRRNPPATPDFNSLNQRATTSYLWDPQNPQAVALPTSNSPTDLQGNSINVFCSGHAFLPDGRLLVAGGHLFDGLGINAASIYDPAKDRWTALQAMNEGRWYPTAVTLPDGTVLVLSGSFPTGNVQAPPNESGINNIPQIWNNGAWESIVDFNGLPLFPASACRSGWPRVYVRRSCPELLPGHRQRRNVDSRPVSKCRIPRLRPFSYV